jgi:RhoGAP domain
MRSLPSDKKLDIYLNILLLLPDEHLHALIYILRFLHEITLNERDNKMNAKNLAICVGHGIMRTSVDGKANIMTEQCATSVSDIVETLIINATKLGYVTDSIYDRSQMLLEMRQKEVAQNADDSFAIENGIKNGIGGGKLNDPVSAKKRRSGSVKGIFISLFNFIPFFLL